MSILGSAVRAELADAIGLKDLRRVLRTELRAIARDVKSLRAALVVLRRAAPPRASSPAASVSSVSISAAQVRALRERFGETRKAFAARVKVSPSIVFMWESGRSTPKRSAVVARLQQLLGEPGKSAPAAATGPSRAKSDVHPQRRPRAKMSSKRRAALKLQGQYMGQIRQLKPRQKAQVKAVKATKGYPAAIALAKKLAAA